MRITLNITSPTEDQDQLLSLDIYPDMNVGTLKGSIEAETRIPSATQHLYHYGNLLTDDNKTMQQLSIGDGEMLALHVRDMRGNAGIEAAAAARQNAAAAQQAQAAQAAPAAAAAAPVPVVGGTRSAPPGGNFGPGRRLGGGGAPSQGVAAGGGRRTGGGGGGGAAGGSGEQAEFDPDPELVRLRLLGDPRLRAEAARQQPQLAQAVEDPVRFAQLFNESYDRDRSERAARQRQIIALNEDLFNPDSQARIEEMIRQERVMENLQSAMEHNPEVFGRVHMLYIDVEVNNHKVKALVDSGAQTTIMSPAVAEACGIMRLVDKRFAGVARGVGTAAILGRVHSAQIKIGSLFLPCSFTVMEGKGVDMLLGLDMLKRHQACIDLARDRLVIQGVEVPFLGEADIPREFEEDEPTISGPGGTSIGGRTGAIKPPTEAPRPGGGAGGGAGPASQPAVAVSGGAARLGGFRPPQPPQPPQQQIQAPRPAQQQQQQQRPTVPPTPSFPQEHIDQLVALGFSREAAINALAATGGNVEYAAGLLFQG